MPFYQGTRRALLGANKAALRLPAIGPFFGLTPTLAATLPTATISGGDISSTQSSPLIYNAVTLSGFPTAANFSIFFWCSHFIFVTGSLAVSASGGLAGFYDGGTFNYTGGNGGDGSGGGGGGGASWNLLGSGVGGSGGAGANGSDGGTNGSNTVGGLGGVGSAWPAFNTGDWSAPSPSVGGMGGEGAGNGDYAAGGGAGGSAGMIVIVCNEFSCPDGEGQFLFALGGAGGDGLNMGGPQDSQGGSGGDGGQILVFARKKRNVPSGNPGLVTGASPGNSFGFSPSPGNFGNDGLSILYEIKKDGTFVQRLWSETWNNL